MTIDTVFENQATGDVGERLLAHNFQASALRPYIGPDGRHYTDVNNKAVPVHNSPATLRYEQWIEVDKKVIAAAKPRLKLVKDLRSAGLTHSVSGGMGKTVMRSETASRAGKASISMDGLRVSDNDRQQYNTVLLPLPIIHDDFQISLREIEASRGANSQPLDLGMAEEAARNVAEETEKLAIGLTSDSYGGATIYGLINSPNRLTTTVRNPATFANWTPKMLVQDVLKTRQLSVDNNYYGPWCLYFGTAWDEYLDDDYSDAKGDNTLRSRVGDISGIEDVATLDYLTGYNMVMVQKTSNVIRMVIGMEMTTLQWDSNGGLSKNFKVMTIMIPQIRADYEGKTGLVHAAPVNA